MKKNILILLTFVLLGLQAKAEDISIYALSSGQEYYILNNFYNCPLGINAAGNGPFVVQYDKSRENDFLWMPESIENSRFVKLKHVSSARYMTSSTSNSYSVSLTSTEGTSNNYQWMVHPGLWGSLSNRKSSSLALGVDKNGSGDIGVWYDKSPQTDISSFAIVPNNGKGLDSSLRQWICSDLPNIISLIQSEVENLKNPLSYRNGLKSSILTTEALMVDTTTSMDVLKEKALVLRDSLATMLSYNDAQVLLTEQEMASFGTTFSLAISNLKLNTTSYPSDSAFFVIRGLDGRGARVTVKEDGDYIFVKDVNLMHVYHNGSLLKDMPLVFLPKLTAQDTEAEWTLVRKSRISGMQAEILSSSKVVTEFGNIETNSYGNKERNIISLSNASITLDEPVDFHLTSEETPMVNAKINLKHEKAWVIFDNTLPSVVESTYLKNIKINGRTASLNNNCRIVIYLNGALVMPILDKVVFTGYEGEQYTGEALEYVVGNVVDLKKNANRIRSFRLKRGYMVTLASSQNGKGYSRVYVADHQDIEVPVLPNALYARISSIHIKKWQYVSKKGWCSTNGSDAISSQTSKMRATWYYTWSADRSSTIDTEYIPIRQHKWWPSIADISKHEDATACLSLNEPEHSEQHNNCDCGGAINEWTACTLTPDFQTTGMRIGSPAPTDASWLTNYIGHCNDMAYRCDFVAIHCYWGPNEAANADAWYNRLKAIYDATKRPIWITEWAYGASWTSEGWPSDWNEKLEKNRAAVKNILAKLEEAPFVERYAYYQWDTQFRNLMDWSDGHITPAGKVYRDTKSTFAYNSKVQFTPVWWAPSLQKPSVKIEVNDIDQTLLLYVTNGNTDVTDILSIQVSRNGGEWTDYYTEHERYLFDSKELSYTFPLSDFDPDNDKIRIYVKRTLGDEAYSPATSFGFIVNPDISVSSQSSVEGWTCTRNAANGYTKATSGDTYLEVWDTSAKGMEFDYHQDVTHLPSGIYELSAAVFNSTNGVADAKVNGSVVLYAEADSILYTAAVTKDSEIDYNNRLVIPGIVVLHDSLRLGIRNIGEMGARWAGADNFRLIRTSALPTDSHATYMDARASQQQVLCDAFFQYTDEAHTEADASAFIVNANCQRKNNYGWKTSQTDFASDKAWDGNGNNNYWNLWKASPFTATLEQDITGLPEGEYALSVLTRGSTNENLSLSVTVMRDGMQKESEESTFSTVSEKGKGETEVKDSGLKNGWFLLETPVVVIRPGDKLHLSYKASFESGSGWYSVDRFSLKWRKIESLPDHLAEPSLMPLPAASRRYDLNGRRTSGNHGIYIENNRKYYNPKQPKL